jgi:mono/diheme cytochrome c family protein
MDQYHPEPYWAQFNQEREIAARPLARLTEAGELPAAGGEQVPIDKRYADLCASCHGAAGGGDGPAGVALTPDDARIATVIKDGGPAVGLSPMMAPWGSVLSDAEVTAMVAHVRQFKK